MTGFKPRNSNDGNDHSANCFILKTCRWTLQKNFIFISGNLTLPASSDNNFFLWVIRDETRQFAFKDASVTIKATFSNLNITSDSYTDFCLSAKFNSSMMSFNLSETSCYTQKATVCRMWMNEERDCTKPFTKLVRKTYCLFEECKAKYQPTPQRD